MLLQRTQHDLPHTVAAGKSYPSIPPGNENRKDRHGFKKRLRIGEFIIEKAIKAISFISFAVIILIFVFVFREAAPIFFPSSPSTVQSAEIPQETYGEDTNQQAQSDNPAETTDDQTVSEDHRVTGSNILGTEWQPVSSDPKYGILPLMVGSMKITIISVLIATPIAILAAIFSSVFAPHRLREFLKPAIEFLSGFPSVVIGFFSLVVLASFLQSIFGYQYRLNAFVGGVALSLAVIPIIYSVTEDALSAVPRYMTEASLALGATKWQTALFVILPAATPGVFAAILLGIGRAFGETMIVLMASGNAALMSLKIFEPVRTMSATIGAEMAEVVFGDTHYNVLFLIGSILFIFTFILNAIAEFYVRNRLQKRLGGTA